MASTYQHDYIELLIGLGVIVVGIIQIYRNRQKFNSYKEAFFLIFCGIFFVVLSTLCNNLIAGRWDKDFIFAFLLLKETDGGGWLCRGLAFFGYIFFVYGVTSLLIVRIKRTKRELTIGR